MKINLLKKTIRIGTRNSPLALWQAETVQRQLEAKGYDTQLVPITSLGDVELDKPLYELGITGVFTKTLDVAMINGQVDIAVHSMKDVPTLLPQGIVQTAVLKRADTEDILITKGTSTFDKDCTIATGSLRRKAQWLNKYPHHTVVGLRGNVNTRLKKLTENPWQGAIFAKAGLKRVDLLPSQYQTLDWMIPAPAQGAMVVVAMEDDAFSCEATAKLNDPNSALCTQVEREFLRVLEGGCTAPIGALAVIEKNMLNFKGVLLSLNGSQKLDLEESCTLSEIDGFGERCAKSLLEKGGAALMEEIRKELQ